MAINRVVDLFVFWDKRKRKIGDFVAEYLTCIPSVNCLIQVKTKLKKLVSWNFLKK